MANLVGTCTTVIIENGRSESPSLCVTLRFMLPLDALENSPRCSKLDAGREGRASAELPQVFGAGTDAQLGAMESEAGGFKLISLSKNTLSGTKYDWCQGKS